MCWYPHRVLAGPASPLTPPQCQVESLLQILSTEVVKSHSLTGKEKPLWVSPLDLLWGETRSSSCEGAVATERLRSSCHRASGYFFSKDPPCPCLNANQHMIREMEREACLGEFYGVSHAAEVRMHRNLNAGEGEQSAREVTTDLKSCQSQSALSVRLNGPLYHSVRPISVDLLRCDVPSGYTFRLPPPFRPSHWH